MEKTIIISLLVIIGVLLCLLCGGLYAFVRYKHKVHNQAKISDNRVCAKQNYSIEVDLIIANPNLTPEEKFAKINEKHIELNKKLEEINNAGLELDRKEEETKQKLLEQLNKLDTSKLQELFGKLKKE